MLRLSISKSGNPPWLLVGLGLVFAFMMANCCPPTLTNGQAVSDCMRAQGAKKTVAVASEPQKHSPQEGRAEAK